MLKLRHQLVFVYGLPLASDEPSFSDAETQWPTDFEGGLLLFQSLVSERDEDSDTDYSSHSVSLIEFRKMKESSLEDHILRYRKYTFILAVKVFNVMINHLIPKPSTANNSVANIISSHHASSSSSSNQSSSSSSSSSYI
ncbi:Hypothetical predicted protein [Mytilus galloprovincialis]|uniref:Uncharacterized protein n=1 Tax=Mytilus galloprovincialis TaxID=29158 RepID=A0A8B6GLN1_MYTGA|nr:Hypothetical predicted protein [Mytilus galloprovincialis]